MEASVPSVTPAARQAPVLPSDRVPVLVWVIAAVFVAAELALSSRRSGSARRWPAGRWWCWRPGWPRCSARAVCTDAVGSWRTIWPDLKHYD